MEGAPLTLRFCSALAARRRPSVMAARDPTCTYILQIRTHLTSLTPTAFPISHPGSLPAAGQRGQLRPTQGLPEMPMATARDVVCPPAQTPSPCSQGPPRTGLFLRPPPGPSWSSAQVHWPDWKGPSLELQRRHIESKRPPFAARCSD